MMRVAVTHRQCPCRRDLPVHAGEDVALLGTVRGPIRTEVDRGIEQWRQLQSGVQVRGRRRRQPHVPEHAGLVDELQDVLRVQAHRDAIARFEVERRREERAVAARVVDARVHAAVQCVDARPERAPGVARIDVPADGAVLVSKQCRRDVGIRRRTLHREIDDAGGCGEAVVQRRRALQRLDTILVLERQIDEIDDRQDAVQSIVAAVLDGDAADGNVAVDGGGGLRGAHACGIAQGIEQTLRLLRLDQRIGNDIDGQRRVELTRAAEAPGLHEIGAVATLAIGRDDDFFQRRRIGLTLARCATGPARASSRSTPQRPLRRSPSQRREFPAIRHAIRDRECHA